MPNDYGLSSLTEDFNAIGLNGLRDGNGADTDVASLDESVRRFGSRGRSRALSRLQEGVASQRQPQRTSQRPPQRTTPPSQAGRRPTNRAVIGEALTKYLRGVAAAPSKTLPAAMAGRERLHSIAEEVQSILGELRKVNAHQAMKGFANVAFISESLGRRFRIIGKRLGESRLQAIGQTLSVVGTQSASIARDLRNRFQRDTDTISSAQLSERFNRALQYVRNAVQLYAALTEGPDAPFPLQPGGAQTVPPDPNAMPMGNEADDPLGLGAPVPTQGMEGQPPMDGASAGSDPLGMGQPMESMDDDDVTPMGHGADDPDLIQNEMDEPPGDDDPLGLGGAGGGAPGSPFGK